MVNVMERTLLILKPDAVLRRYVGAFVFKKILQENFEILSIAEEKVTREFAEVHYAEHRGKFFYDWLVRYITLSPVVVAILKGDNVVQRMRNILGETMAHLARPDTIRGRYGIWGGINVAHASDSTNSAEQECDLWIAELDLRMNAQWGKEKAIEYINRWDGKTEDNTMAIRDVCRRYINDEIMDPEKRIEELIRKDIDPSYSNLAYDLTKLIVENVDFGKKK